ncbi:MAG TPA: carboxypeptidase regulatory-like domain-containing protein [Edaphobacter sp.]|nr:carboxypeptidase regulatory-like domain-containing protein [Edaphobacter sp.]
MKMILRTTSLLVLIIGCLFVCPTSLAQTSYGSIAGSITDSTGAAIPNATITIRNTDTGETHVTQSKANGGYLIDAIGTGSYDVTVEAASFSKQVISKVAVQPTTITSVNALLKVGSASTVVEVSSSSEILKTESGEVSESISTKEISDLPVNSLNAFALATTLPGVTTVTTVGLTNGTAFSVNGSRPRENNFLIEGQDDNDAGIEGQGLQPENQEALESVTFLLSGSSSEFGRGGNVSNLVYKSGTNTFHGAVWDRLFNSSLNATNHQTTYNKGVKAKTRENIYGYRFGGPVLHDKLFFFVSQQFDHFRSSSVLSTLIVPTTAGYATLNQYKSNPQIAKLLQAYGGFTGFDAASGKFPSSLRNVALGPDPVTGVDRGTVAYGGNQRIIGNLTNSNEFVTKVDWQALSNDKVQFRFIRSPYLTPTDTGNFPSQLPLFDTNQSGTAYNAGITENHIFNSHMLNELRMSYGRIGFSFGLRPDTLSNPLATGPTVTINGVQGWGIPTNIPQGRFHNTYQLQDALSITKGSHSMKAGFDIAQVRVRDAVPFVFYGSFSYQLSSAYSSLGNFMDDFSGTSSATLTKNFGNNIARPTLTNQAYYFQDHWKATPSLAVDLGLRYEYYGAPFNYIAYPAVDLNNLACFPTTSAVSCRVPVKPNYKNFGPRIGFAYTPGASNKTVIRGALGIFYDNVFTNVADNIQASAPNASAPTVNGVNTGRGTAAWSTQFATLNPNPAPTNSVTSTVPNLRNPLTYQYNLAVERALPWAMSLTAGYIGSRSEHLYSLTYINPLVPGSTTQRVVAPTRGPISVHDNSGDGSYNSGTLELERKYRSGAQARIGYTYSKSLDNTSEEYSSGNYSAYPQIEPALGGRRGQDWGPSAFDHKQRAVLSFVYAIPKWHADGAMKIAGYVVNGFQLSGIVSFQTGSVMNLQTNQDQNGDGIVNDRPVLANKNAPYNSFAVRQIDGYPTAPGSSPNVYCDGTYVANGLAKNPSTGANDQFCHVVTLDQVHFYMGAKNTQNTTISRNTGYTPGVLQNDISIQRNFPIHESHSVDFRAEMFNFLNHANTGIPNLLLQSTSNQPVAAGYTQGTFNYLPPTATGNRSIRFFLKYSF